MEFKHSRFKIGDLVKGNDSKHKYLITNEHSVCKVVEINRSGSSCDDINVEIINHFTQPRHIGDKYWVDSRNMVLIDEKRENKTTGGNEKMIELTPRQKEVCDEDTQVLMEEGILDSCMRLTETGKIRVLELLANKTLRNKIAEEIRVERKAKEEKAK